MARRELELDRIGETTPLLYPVAKFIFWVTGWRAQGPPPPYPKFVAIFGPHTIFWDAPLGAVMSFVLRVKGNWFVKSSAFIWPFSIVLRKVGAIPVDRDANYNRVDMAVEEFRRRDRIILAIAPEGTRKPLDHWKSGFYHIAVKAEVPIVMCFFDYERKVCGNGGTLWPTGDVDVDMAKIRAFYETVTPARPENRSEVRLREQDPPSVR